MWVVFNHKSKEIQTLKNSFFKILGGVPEFYSPKIRYEKYVNSKKKIFQKSILNNYIICNHHKFSNSKFIILLKNCKGINYFLSGSKYNQNELEKFVTFCKNNEDENGFLKQSFFAITKKNKGKFISGPFTQMVFDIIEEKEKKIRILLNNVNVTVSKQSKDLLYSYI